MKKQILSAVLCLALLLGILPAGVLAAETDVQNDAASASTVSAAELRGKGTEDDPYLITGADDLKAFRDKVNGGEAGACARLMSDIEFTEDVTAENWTAIGTEAQPYTGTFDGNNYSIKNTSSTWRMSTRTSGLFGYVGADGKIRSLTLQLYVEAKSGTALLTYENKGTIEQCSVHALARKDSAIGKDTPFCNFAYTNSGTIRNCLSILNSHVSNAAGFAETNSGTIENSLCSIIESGGSNISQAYAVAKTNSGTVTNCCCTLYSVSFGEPLDSSLVTTSYLDIDETKRAATIKQIVWKLNNGSTDPWRYGGDAGFNSDYYPTLDPTDAKVTASDGSKTETPHTHRVDGVIREFADADIVSDEEYIYFSVGQYISDEWKPTTNKTICLNGYDLTLSHGLTVEQADVTFTVTDCKDTGKITASTSGGGAGVTISGGTFVLDSVSVTGCATGIDFQSGTVKLSGSARVTGNAANIKLAQDQKLTFGLLDETACVGVTYAGDIAAGGEVEITDRTGLPYARQIMSDSGELIVSTGENAVLLTRPAEHKHCICGADHKEITYTDVDGTEKTAHGSETETVFQLWDPYSHQDADGNPTLPEAAGSYYLTQSVELSGSPAWEPSGEVNLCLNGMTVTFTHVDTNGNDNGLVWLDEAGDHLTVTDCKDTGTLKMADGLTRRNCIRILNGAEYTLYAGTMTNFARAVSIGQVHYHDSMTESCSGTFTMYGGTLTGNISGTPLSTGLGSAVSATGADAHVVMYGGKIINNKTAGAENRYRYGGGVFVEADGSFTMYGGEISGNGKADESQQGDESRKYGARYGGGVYVKGTFTMTGGKISSNTVTEGYGGGVCVIGTFTMTGGEISDNTVTKGFGGGIYLRSTGTPARMENAVIRGNSVQEHERYNYYGGGGGGVYYTAPVNAALTLKNTTISDNTLNMTFGNSDGYGGGAGVYGDADITIEDCTISGNKLTGLNNRADGKGALGGAGVCVPYGNLTIRDSKITGNTAISDVKATDDQELVFGGVLFCDSTTTFTVSGTVKISGNTVDGADGNVYLEKIPSTNRYQTQITVDGTLSEESSIGVMARTAENGDVQAVQVKGENDTIPSGVFTSDKDEYKAVLSGDGKYVTLTVNNDEAEVTHESKTTGYETLAAALAAAQSGDTVTVLQNCALSEAVTLNGITLDLNGKTVTATMTATAAISLSEPVTIRNGTINGTVSGGSALILCQRGSLELKDVTITESAAKQAVAIVQGSLFMDSGTIDGGLQIAGNSKVELSGGTFINANGSAITGQAVTGGLSSYLKSGCAYQMDGQLVDLSKKTDTESGKTVTVVSCTHGFDGKSAECKYCDFVCKHENVNEDSRVCATCGATMAASVQLNPGSISETPIYVWYLTLEEAFASIKPTDGQRKVFYYNDQTLTNNVEISGNVICYANGKRLDFSEGKSFVVENGGRLQLAGGGYTGAVTVKSGGELVVSQKPENSVGTLTVYDGSESDLLYSHFDKIEIVSGDKTLADLLGSTSTLRHDDDNTWATDAELAGTSIENVTVAAKPFYNEKLTVTPTTEAYNGDGNAAKLSVSLQTPTTNYGDTTYRWCAVWYDGNGDLTEHEITKTTNDSTYTESISGVGTYTFVCYVTRDGYTRRTNEVVCTITPATATFTTEPTANTLTYDGTAQALVTAGTTSDGEVRYGFNENVWHNTVLTGTKAGTYTVYYKIFGDDNHTDSEIKSVTVTIAPKSIEGAAITLGSGLTYTGSAQTPTIESVTLDGKALTADDYEIVSGNTATDAGEYTLTIRGKGNYTGEAARKWSIGKVSASCTAPTANTLTYTGEAQTLVTAGSTSDGTVEYSTDGQNWQTALPTGTNAGVYTVYYRVVGDSNHTDKEFSPVSVTIAKQPVAVPAADTTAFTYNGEDQTYTIAPNDNYTVAGNVWRNAAAYNVAVTLKDTDNYVWSGGDTGAAKFYTFTIAPKTVTVTALDKSAYVGSTAPDLSAPKADVDYKVEGLLGDDELTAPPALAYAAEPDMTKEGETEITASGADAGGNYEIDYVPGKLNVSVYIPPVFSITVAETEHGSVSASPVRARSGQTVTLTVTPDDGYTLETLTVTDRSGNALELTDLGDGKYSFTMPAGKADVQATFMDDNTMLNFFVDVKAEDYFYDAVLWAVKNGITNGTDELHFSPNAPCTRAQIVTFLWRAAGEPAVDYLLPFTDVESDAYYAEAVRWAASEGIVKGTSDTTFSPDDTCTRAQITAMLWRRAGQPVVNYAMNFTDVEEGAYYAEAVRWAASEGITSGTGDGTFSPDDTCTRAQVVTFLRREAQGK